MKILLGVPEYPPNYIGGGGEVYKNLAENYKKFGHEVVVIYGYYPTKTWYENIKEYTNESGIKFYQIPEMPYPKSMPFFRTAMLPNLKSWWQLKKIILKEKPDVAHLHGYGLIFINIIAGILRKLKIKYIFTIHGYPETQNKSNKMIRLIWNMYIKIIMNRTLKFAEKIIYVSKYVQADKRNIFPEKSAVIYNGIKFSDFEETKENINIRKKYNILKETKILFSLGRISEMKGFQNVIKLIPKFLEQGIGVKYFIAGADEGYKNVLETLIKEAGVEKSVEFVGFLDLEAKKQYLFQCDIFAVPSLWEPFGLVALEGMIYNKIVLTSNAGGLKEVLEKYENKILMDDKDIIKKVLTHELKPLNKEIFKTFDYGLIAKSYLFLLEKYAQ